jgi:hypothetical protein
MRRIVFSRLCRSATIGCGSRQNAEQVELVVQVRTERAPFDLILHRVNDEVDLPEEHVAEPDDADRVLDQRHRQRPLDVLVLFEHEKGGHQHQQIAGKEPSARPSPQHHRHCVTADEKDGQRGKRRPTGLRRLGFAGQQ